MIATHNDPVRRAKLAQHAVDVARAGSTRNTRRARRTALRALRAAVSDRDAPSASVPKPAMSSPQQSDENVFRGSFQG